MMNPQDNTPLTNPVDPVVKDTNPVAPMEAQTAISGVQATPPEPTQVPVSLETPAQAMSSPGMESVTVAPASPETQPIDLNNPSAVGSPAPVAQKSSKKMITIVAIVIVALAVLVLGFVTLKPKNTSQSNASGTATNSNKDNSVSSGGTAEIKSFVALIEADKYIKAHNLILENNGITISTADKVQLERATKYGVSVGLLAGLLQKVDAVSYKTDTSKAGIVTEYFKYDRPYSKKLPVGYFTVTAKNSGTTWIVNDFQLHDTDPATKAL